MKKRNKNYFFDLFISVAMLLMKSLHINISWEIFNNLVYIGLVNLPKVETHASLKFQMHNSYACAFIVGGQTREHVAWIPLNAHH